MVEVSRFFKYFTKAIGTYPNKEIDIIIDHIGNFSYPGVNIIFDLLPVDFIERKVVREIAYDWYYQAIKEDQYNNDWIIESFKTNEL